MIDSEKVFKTISEFQNTVWYKVYYREKLIETMSSQNKWRPAIERQVKFKELMLK